MLNHPLHPLLVHFPIALLFTAVFFEILGFLVQREEYRRFGLWLMILGLAGGIVAAGIGFRVEEAVEAAGVPEEAIDRHEFFAIITLITFALTLAVRYWTKNRWTPRKITLYFSLAMAGLLLLGITGFFGGELVYRYGAGMLNPPAVQSTAPEGQP